jgi:hypothetical protein
MPNKDFHLYTGGTLCTLYRRKSLFGNQSFSGAFCLTLFFNLRVPKIPRVSIPIKVMLRKKKFWTLIYCMTLYKGRDFRNFLLFFLLFMKDNIYPPDFCASSIVNPPYYTGICLWSSLILPIL